MEGGTLEKLFFQISLIDKLSAPASQICKSLETMHSRFETGQLDMTMINTSVTNVATAFDDFIAPVQKCTKALKNIEVLGVSGKDLDTLGQAFMRFSSSLEKDSAKIVALGYKMRSSVKDIASGALKAFNKSTRFIQAGPAKLTKPAGGIFNNKMSKAGQPEKPIGALGKIVPASGGGKIAAMTEQVGKFRTIVENLQNNIGDNLLPLGDSISNKFSGMTTWITGLVGKVPALASAIGLATMAAQGLSFGLEALNTVQESLSLASSIYDMCGAIKQWSIWGKIATAAQWLFNTSLWGCPIVWIIAGIGLLVGAIVALIYYWDEVCAWVMKYSEYLLMLAGPIGMMAGLVIHFWDDIVAAAEWCFNKITGWVSGIWNFGKNVVSAIFQWIVGKITGFMEWMTEIPIIGGTVKAGLDALKDFAGMEIHQTAKIERPVVPTVNRQRNQDIPAGGIQSNNSSRTTNYGGVTINTAKPFGPGELEEMLMLEA